VVNTLLELRKSLSVRSASSRSRSRWHAGWRNSRRTSAPGRRSATGARHTSAASRSP